MKFHVDWSAYSEPQLKALIELSFAVPMHETYLRQHFRVRGSSITSLIRQGLVRRLFYKEQNGLSGIPFLTLTQNGDAVRRDYVRWHRRLLEKLGSLPPAMAAVAGHGLRGGHEA